MVIVVRLVLRLFRQ